MSSPVSWVKVRLLPTFECNEHLLSLPRKDGKEDWEVFADAVRAGIAEELGIPLSDSIMEDKFDYRAQLYGKKKTLR